MDRNRLVAAWALGLVLTIATIVTAVMACSADVDPARSRWVVIAIGTLAVLASTAFARAALREVGQLTAALRASRAGGVNPRTSSCDAADLVHEVMTRLGRDAVARGITLRCDRAEGTVHVDVDSIRTTIETLTNRAMTSSPPGASVELEAIVQAQDLRFAVTSITSPPVSSNPTVWVMTPELRHCQSNVEAHGGRFGFDVEGARATCWFTLASEPRLLR